MAETNILFLPRFESAEFDLPQNSDWLDGLFFTSSSADQAAPIEMVGAMTLGSPTVAVESALTLIPGMPVSAVKGIPTGSYIGTIPTLINFTLVDIDGNPVNANATTAVAALTFQPLPLDITGIRFKAMVRHRIGGAETVLVVDTEDGTFVNGGTSGVLSFNVLQDKMSKISPNKYYMDIVAEADGHIINLFPINPAVINFAKGITTP